MVYFPAMAAQPSPSPSGPRGMKRVFLLVMGCVALTLGGLGVILPLVPATPFILLGAACFAGSWPAMHRRLLANKHFGPMLQKGPGARYIPRRTQLSAVAFTLVSVGATIFFAVKVLWLKILLGAIALGVSAFLLWMPSRPREPM